MSRRVFTPSNQNKLTNVSIVRLKKGGIRLEIACYKNKVLEWRNGVESDLDEVLQTRSVYTNVSKGQMASQEELKKAFNLKDTEDIDVMRIILEILKKGELQVGEKERSAQTESLLKDIATTVSDKCINPETRRPYPVTIIEKAMADLHFSVNPNKNSKQQALDVIKQLQQKQIIPIARAQMRLRAVGPGKDGKKVKEKLGPLIVATEEEDWGEEFELVCLIDPGQFRAVTDMVTSETKGRGQVEVLNVRDVVEGDEKY